MDSHKKLLSILHIVYGSIHILAFIFVNMIISAIMPFILSEIESSGDESAMIVTAIVQFVRGLIIFLLLIVPIPSIIGGIGQLYKKAWGMTFMMISGCLSLLNVPIGSALGVYTIWVFLEDQKQSKEQGKVGQEA